MTAVALKTESFRRLVAALEGACPALKDRITFEAERDDQMAWPKCGIRLVRSPFKPYEPRVHQLLTGEAVYDVGHFEALVQLRLGAPTNRQRIDLGEQLLAPFLEGCGVLNTPVPDVYGAVCAWELDEEGWSDEAAFDNKRWSTLVLTGFIPALVKRRTYTINDLRLAFAEELPTIPVETVRINVDGTITKVP